MSPMPQHQQHTGRRRPQPFNKAPLQPASLSNAMHGTHVRAQPGRVSAAGVLLKLWKIVWDCSSPLNTITKALMLLQPLKPTVTTSRHSRHHRNAPIWPTLYNCSDKPSNSRLCSKQLDPWKCKCVLMLLVRLSGCRRRQSGSLTVTQHQHQQQHLRQWPLGEEMGGTDSKLLVRAIA